MKLKKPKPPTIFQQPPVVLNEYKSVLMNPERLARIKKLYDLSKTIRNT